MKPSELLESHRKEICRMVEQNHARNPRVFGSTLHGSDAPETTLLNLGALQIELEQLLGIPVDILTPGDLPVKFRARVLKEAIPV